MRSCLLVVGLLVVAACGKEGSSSTPAQPHAPARVLPRDGAPAAPPSYADLGEALVAIIPDDTRVIGFGELHSRTDRAQVRSALSAFTEALPRISARLSDLIVETWIVDPTCGQGAVQATEQLETTVKRPESTKSEIAQLAEAARAAGVQPHAMTLSCDDYKTLMPGGEIDPVAMLDLTTRELGRIAKSAVAHRGNQPAARPWIAVYGGALHNTRDPDPGVAEWSYAAAIDEATDGRFVEIDIIVPELAAADPVSQRQPWFPLVAQARDRVQVHTRGPRSFVVILPASR